MRMPPMFLPERSNSRMAVFIYKPSRHRRSGSTMQKQKSFHSAQTRFDAARKTLPGFPWKGKFETNEQIDKYLSGDKIVCLLCGKCYLMLGSHTHRIHGIWGDDYKEKFGIPQNRGLANKNIREEHRIKSKELIKQRPLWSNKLETIIRNRENGYKFRRPLVKATKHESANRFRAITIEQRRKYHVFTWHLSMLETVWRYNKKIPPKEQASWSQFKKRWLQDSELEREMRSSRKAFRPKNANQEAVPNGVFPLATTRH